MDASMVQPSVVKLTILGALVLASCGGNDGSTPTASPSTREPEQVVHRYFTALGEGDGRTTCALMTTVGQQGMKQLPEGEQVESCERAVAVLARDSIPVPNPELRDLQPVALAARFDSPPGIRPHEEEGEERR
jgi:hypothetical protein